MAPPSASLSPRPGIEVRQQGEVERFRRVERQEVDPRAPQLLLIARAQGGHRLEAALAPLRRLRSDHVPALDVGEARPAREGALQLVGIQQLKDEDALATAPERLQA